METIVLNETPGGYGESGEGKILLTKMGNIVPVSFDQWLCNAGRAFLSSPAARETASAMGGTSFDDTKPALILDVPTGTTCFPLEIGMNQGGTVAGAFITVLITLSDKVRYSSGGASQSAQNMKFNEPRAANCTPYADIGGALTANANTDDILLNGQLLPEDVDALAGGNVFWSSKRNVAPPLVGPASLAIYAFAGTTEASWFWHLIWGELPSELVVT